MHAELGGEVDEISVADLGDIFQEEMMPTLPEDEARLFYKLYPALLVSVNAKHKIQPQVSTPDEFLALPVQDRVQVRNRLYEDIGIIDAFVQENPFGFPSQDLDIVASWKHFFQDSFHLFRHLKNYSIFIRSSSPPLAYGVLSLVDRLEDMFPNLPVYVQGVLLPFKGRIVYDGYLGSYNMIYGGGIRRMITNTYNEAKAEYGVITSLPFEAAAHRSDAAEMLKFYLKSEQNREHYWEEIQDILEDNPELQVLYHQESGKRHARTYGKRLREIGLDEGWFGLLKGLIVASGKTRTELEKNIQSVVPPSMQEYVYTYRLKPKFKK